MYSHNKGFLNKAPFTQTLQARIEKWDLMKLKSSCTANSQSSEEEVHGLEEILQLNIQQKVNTYNIQVTQEKRSNQKMSFKFEQGLL